MSFEFHDIPNHGDVIGVHGRISRKNLHFVNSTLDTYEGMGMMRTVDRHEGRIMFWIEPDYWPYFVAFAEEMNGRVGLEIGTIVNETMIPEGSPEFVNARCGEVMAAESPMDCNE